MKMFLLQASGQPDKSKTLPVLPSSVANSQKELETHLQIAEVANSAALTPARGAVVTSGGPSTKLANDMVLPSFINFMII